MTTTKENRKQHHREIPNSPFRNEEGHPSIHDVQHNIKRARNSTHDVVRIIAKQQYGQQQQPVNRQSNRNKASKKRHKAREGSS